MLSEHWVVYHYWSTAARRFEVAVLELYDLAPRVFKPRDLLFGSVAETTSSFEPAPLEVRLPQTLDLAMLGLPLSVVRI